MAKKLSKYIPAFDYINKILIVLSATSGEQHIYCFFCKYYWHACRNSKYKL